VPQTPEDQNLSDRPFRLGDCLVDPRLNRLARGDESIQIEPKMMDVLVCLAEKADGIRSNTSRTPNTVLAALPTS